MARLVNVFVVFTLCFVLIQGFKVNERSGDQQQVPADAVPPPVQSAGEVGESKGCNAFGDECSWWTGCCEGMKCDGFFNGVCWYDWK
ncbi:hypothetical protein SNE40_013597 [Patella caerulea]|uniref:Uncharacterized protein n=1 Tax=Patella caerulea TaxID=87958 RepID=A0AAN8JFC9_PATCE